MARLYCAVILLFSSCLGLTAQAQDTAEAGQPGDPARSAGTGTDAAGAPPAGAAAAGPPPPPEKAANPHAHHGWKDWLDPDKAPFLPVPEIDVDPNSGTTLGLIPTRLATDDAGAIRKIIAPDIIHNPYFGWGGRARIFAYPTEDTHWSIVGGGKQKVESEFDAVLETGRLRDVRWSWTLEAVYDRSGTPRFYGFGNESQIYNQSVYTDQQLYAKVVAGWNITKKWQLAYMFMPRKVKILGAKLEGIPSLTQNLHHVDFQGLLGLGVTQELLSRVILTYDTRDDVTVPTDGMFVQAYGGVAGRNGFPDDSLFSEAGVEYRQYWSPTPQETWAAHVGLRYMPSTPHTPFWALSSLGGDTSVLGESEPLRGYGTGRYYDRDAFVMNLEYRRQIYAVDFSGTHIDLQLTPFLDAGRVFHDPSTFPFTHLHPVGGIGIRAIARPSVVGYVDLGRGGEGLAVFTGINYPF